MDIKPLIWPAVDRKELERVLDEVGHDVRLDALLELGPRDMGRLFDAAIDNDPITLDHFVPADTRPLGQVIHEGKNSLPLFSRFQKRFCRPVVPASEKEVWGYNHQSMQIVTGPGYFVAYPQGPKEVLFDYSRVPAGQLPSRWPPVIPNSARFGRFVYHGTKDVMRRVSQFVSIGRLYRGDRPADTWFLLVRCVPSLRVGAPDRPDL
jgi:hypothetical protein